MFVKSKTSKVVGLLLLISLVCSVNTNAQGGLAARLSSKISGHVSTLSRSFAVGIFTLAALCNGQVCSPQAMAAAEQASRDSIVQNTDKGQVSTKVVREDRFKNLGYEREISTRLGGYDKNYIGADTVSSTEELWLASFYGDLEKVKMLDSKFPYDDFDAYPLYEGEEAVFVLDEALTYAGIGGHLDVAKYLVAKGAKGQVSTKVVREDRFKNLGYEREISARLGGYDKNYIGVDTVSSTEELWLASYYGDLEKVKMLDSKFPYDDFDAYPLHEGEEAVFVLEEALMYAVIGGHLDVVKYLVAKKGVPHYAFNFAWDLRLAVKHQHWNIVLFLAESGAELDLAIEYAADIQSETALQHLRTAGVVRENRLKDLGYEREINARLGGYDKNYIGADTVSSTEELWLASYYGDLEKVKMLDSKFPYDDFDAYPLHEGEEAVFVLDGALTYAVIGGHLDVVKYLVAKKGVPHYAFNFAWDLRLAVKHQHWNIVPFLAESGAELDLAIEYAADIQSETALLHLRTAGAEVKHLNSAMIDAALSRKLNAVKFLHTHGADDLNRAMFTAANMGDLSIVKYLREQGADALNEALLHTVRRLDRTSLGLLTITRDQKDVIKFLIAEGADNFAEAIQAITKSVVRHDAHDMLDLLLENLLESE